MGKFKTEVYTKVKEDIKRIFTGREEVWIEHEHEQMNECEFDVVIKGIDRGMAIDVIDIREKYKRDAVQNIIKVIVNIKDYMTEKQDTISFYLRR